MIDKFAVLMSVYGATDPGHLAASLQSVFDQTLKPEEVILVKDGPLVEGTEEVIELWKSKEPYSLKTVSMPKNVGLARALNHALKCCSFQLVVRMDSDDISQKDRFEKQIKVFENDKVDVVGAYIEERDEDMKRVIGIRKVPLEHENIAEFLKWKNPMNHVSVVFRKNAVLSVGGYPEELNKIQDYVLWGKMIKCGYKFKNIPESLVMVRTGRDFLKRRGGLRYFKYEVAVLSYLKRLGFIGYSHFLISFFLRLFVRISPERLRRMVYGKIRGL